jgi:flagellar basal-body rod protein FlgB
VFIDGLVNADSMPTIEAAAQFAARRQDVLVHNIANLSTPFFQQRTVSVRGFQSQLADAVDQRRRSHGGQRGDLNLKGSREVQSVRDSSGQMRLSLTPRTSSGNILFHDRNDRDLERSMADLAETVATFRVATDLFRTRIALLQSAITERA